jgi:hypothetical protein
VSDQPHDWPYQRLTQPHSRKKLHRRFTTDVVLAFRAFLLLEYDRLTALVAEYQRHLADLAGVTNDPMVPFISKAHDQYVAHRKYVEDQLHNLSNRNWLDSDLKAAFKAADEYVPGPFSRPLEMPEVRT